MFLCYVFMVSIPMKLATRSRQYWERIQEKIMENKSTHSMKEIKTKGKWMPLLRQIRVLSAVWSLYFISGIFLGTPTVVRPQLAKEANSTADVGDEIFSWIYSVSSFSGALFGFILTFLAHFFGRKKTTLLITANMVAASVLVYFSYNAVHILISQMFYGILLAGNIVIFPTAITEYSSTKYRGVFLTLKSATLFWGIWSANAIGIFSHYKNIGLLSMIISSYALITSFFMPESPYWLAFHGKYDECMLAHRLLKGEGEMAEKELEVLIAVHKESKKNKNTKHSLTNYVRKYFALIIRPEIGKPVALSLLIFAMYELSGKMVCAVYSIELMKKITTNESETHLAVLVLDGFSVLGMYMGCGLSKILKRRTMLLVNSSIGVTFLLTMSLYLYLEKWSIITGNTYVIIVLLVGYSLAMCCGPLILSTSIFGELVPIKARSFSACFICLLFLSFGGIHSKLAPLMFENLDVHGSFLTYGICSIICIILAYSFLPETKDKSLHEISAIFSKKKTGILAEEIGLIKMKPEK